MNWREYITDHTTRNGLKPFPLRPAAGADSIAALEGDFGTKLPDELIGFWLQADGAKDEYGWWFIWGVEHLWVENRKFRSGAEWLKSVVFCPAACRRC